MLFAESPATTPAEPAFQVAAWFVGLVMLLAGLIGGLLGYLFAQTKTPSATDPEFRYPVVTNLLAGVVAAFLIPLFLNTISSTLLTKLAEGKGTWVDLFILFGFCLVAAIGARAFVQTMSDRVLRMAQQAKADAAEAQKKAGEAKQQAVEATAKAEEVQAAQPPVEPEPETIALAAGAGVALTAEELAVLGAVRHPVYTLRTSHGIAQAVGKTDAEVIPILDRLVEEGYLRLVGKNGRPRWGLTAKGGQALETV